MSSTLSAFNWKGKSSIFADAKRLATNATPATNHPLRNGKRSTDNAFTGAGGQTKPGKPPALYKTNGMVKPSNTGFDIPSRAQAQADTDKRRGLVKGGI